MSREKIQELEKQCYELSNELFQLRRDQKPDEVKNYTFETLNGEVTLESLFGDRETLFFIHNMGQGCRYCTTWGDGINAFLPHLEDQFSVALVSKDDPATQRRFANERGWRFRTVSHGGGAYMTEQSVGQGNTPGMVCYIKKDGKIFRKNSTVFGPGDQFCSLWHILSLGGFNYENWTPQFNYWKRPEKLDDGGNNLR